MKRVEIREACFEDLNEINRLVERVFDQFVAPGYSDEGVESFFKIYRFGSHTCKV